MMDNVKPEDVFKCCSCGWQGTEKQMIGDSTFDSWSNTVCPMCGMWDFFDIIVSDHGLS